MSLSIVANTILPNLQEKSFHEGSSRLKVTMCTNFFILLAMISTIYILEDTEGIINALS